MITLHTRNRAALEKLFPAVFASNNPEFYQRLERPGLMPLYCERVMSDNPLYPRAAIGHTYEQNGDLMRDPEIVFELRGDAVFAVEWRMDPLGVHREFRAGSPAGIQTDRFAAQWFRNLKAQGFRAVDLAA
jgi:hypothetical protein